MQYSIFALELAVRIQPGDPLREALRGILTAQSETADRAAKRDAYAAAARVLGQNIERIEYGCWDYFDDHHRAVTDFAMWSDGMLGEEGVRREASSEPGPRYLTYTMAFLLAQGSGSDRRLRERCDVDEEGLWGREVFAQMLANVSLIDFGDVRADIAYLIPGSEAYALTEADLRRGKFDHLRRLA